MRSKRATGSQLSQHSECMVSVSMLSPVLYTAVGQYLSLDSDHNGMLSKQELAR